jgi:hypothetical protein
MRYAIIFLALSGCGNRCYEMPNGVMCDYKTNRGPYSEGVEEFSGCSDNRIYVNPMSYKPLKPQEQCPSH